MLLGVGCPKRRRSAASATLRDKIGIMGNVHFRIVRNIGMTEFVADDDAAGVKNGVVTTVSLVPKTLFGLV
jgi:hypothetical protein